MRREKKEFWARRDRAKGERGRLGRKKSTGKEDKVADGRRLFWDGNTDWWKRMIWGRKEMVGER